MKSLYCRRRLLPSLALTAGALGSALAGLPAAAADAAVATAPGAAPDSALLAPAAAATPSAAAAAAAVAPPSAEALLTTLIALIRTLVDQGVLSASRAQEMLRQAGADPAALAQQPAPAPAVAEEAPPVVRVPYIPQLLKDELRDDLRQEVLSTARTEHWTEPGVLPAWLSRLSWYGDVRLRAQRDSYGGANDAPQAVDTYYQLPSGTTLTTHDSRNRPRLRARMGVDAVIDEHFDANIMFVTTTGDDATASPVSFNADQGRYGRPFSAGIDVAYLQWSPRADVHLTGGRIGNPYLSSDSPYLSSDLIWWRDLAFDGVLARYAPRFGTHWSAFANAGAHPLATPQRGPYNLAPQQWLYAGQTGVAYTAEDQSVFRLDTSVFSFVGTQGTLNPNLNPASPAQNTVTSASAPLFRQRGNTMFDINWFANPNAALFAYAGQFREFELDANFELAHFEPLRIALDLDYVRNIAFNAGEIQRHIGLAALGLPTDKTGKNGIDRPRVAGYQAGVLVGRHAVQRFGDWQAFGGYKYLERDAVLDAFSSPDYHLGGTDVKGPFLGVNLGLGTNASVVLRYSATKPIDAPLNFEISEWFLDFTGRF